MTALRLVPPTSHFERLWRLGYRNLVPIIPPGAPLSEKSSLWRSVAAGHDSRGKVPGVLGVDGLWRGFDWMQHETSETDLALWASWGAGVGIKTGGADGVVMIDADTRQKDLANTIKERIEQRIGRTPLRIGENPKAGYIVRCSEPLAYSRVELGKHPVTGKPERIELLNGGRQFVAEGQHPCGVAYRWPESNPLVELDRLVQVSPQQLTDLLTDLSRTLPGASGVVTERMRLVNGPVNQETLRGDPRLVQRALACIPNNPENFPTYDDFIAIGFAIKAALPDDRELALELFQQWAGRWPEGNDPPELETFDQADDSALDLSAEPLIDGLLDQEAMTVLYGESNTGKSFVALDMAYHIATGRDWAGRRVARMGVVYVAAEGGKGTRKRVRALRLRFGKANVPMAFLMVPVDLLHADADTGPLIERIRQFAANLPQPLKVGLIVIDTLSRALAGGEENRSADMGALVANLDRIRQAIGAHILVVHHAGKDPAKGARGHSLLRAATDTELEITNWQLAVTKQRDLEGSFATGFALDPVVIGERADGRPVTSAIVRLVARNAIVAGIASAREQDVLEAIRTLQGLLPAEQQAEGVGTGEIGALLGVTYSALRSHLTRLNVKSLIISTKRGYWRLQPSGINVMD
jgi:hypothetical protein